MQPALTARFTDSVQEMGKSATQKNLLDWPTQESTCERLEVAAVAGEVSNDCFRNRIHSDRLLYCTSAKVMSFTYPCDRSDTESVAAQARFG